MKTWTLGGFISLLAFASVHTAGLAEAGRTNTTQPAAHLKQIGCRPVEELHLKQSTLKTVQKSGKILIRNLAAMTKKELVCNLPEAQAADIMKRFSDVGLAHGVKPRGRPSKKYPTNYVAQVFTEAVPHKIREAAFFTAKDVVLSFMRHLPKAERKQVFEKHKDVLTKNEQDMVASLWVDSGDHTAYKALHDRIGDKSVDRGKIERMYVGGLMKLGEARDLESLAKGEPGPLWRQPKPVRLEHISPENLQTICDKPIAELHLSDQIDAKLRSHTRYELKADAFNAASPTQLSPDSVEVKEGSLLQIGELISKTPFELERLIGPKNALEVAAVLESNGLCLNVDVSGWQRSPLSDAQRQVSSRDVLTERINHLITWTPDRIGKALENHGAAVETILASAKIVSTPNAIGGMGGQKTVAEKHRDPRKIIELLQKRWTAPHANSQPSRKELAAQMDVTPETMAVHEIAGLSALVIAIDRASVVAGKAESPLAVRDEGSAVKHVAKTRSSATQFANIGSRPIEHLGLNWRTVSKARKNKICTIGDLAAMPESALSHPFTEAQIADIKKQFKYIGLAHGTQLSGNKPEVESTRSKSYVEEAVVLAFLRHLPKIDRQAFFDAHSNTLNNEQKAIVSALWVNAGDTVAYEELRRTFDPDSKLKRSQLAQKFSLRLISGLQKMGAERDLQSVLANESEPTWRRPKRVRRLKDPAILQRNVAELSLPWNTENKLRTDEKERIGDIVSMTPYALEQLVGVANALKVSAALEPLGLHLSMQVPGAN